MNSELGSKRVSMPVLMALLSGAIIVVAVFVTSQFSSAPPKQAGVAPAQEQAEAKPQAAQPPQAQPAPQPANTAPDPTATQAAASQPTVDPAEGQSPDTLPPPPPADDHPPAN